MALSKPTKDIDITTCPICLEEFKTPKCLPCLHNFCETCLNSYIISAFKSESENKVGKSHFNCPVCRRTATPSDATVKHNEWAKQFPLNHTIVSLMDQNKLKTKAKLCDPCKSMDDDVTAISWCLECNEAFCQVCASVHKKQKISKYHVLKDIEEMSVIPLITSSMMCESHKAKSIEAFCMDHNQPCCITCITIHHRKCDQVSTLEDAAKGVLHSEDLVNLLQRLKDTDVLNRDLIREKREIIKTLEDQKTAIEKELQDSRQRIIDKFDKLLSKFSQELTQIHNQRVKELTSSIEDLENRNKIVENCMNMMETCRKHSSETQMFLEMKKILEEEKEHTAELRQIHTEHKIVEYKFRLNDDFQKLITELQTVGQIDVTEKVRINLKECMPELVSSFSLKEKCGVNTSVYGGCFMSDDTLLLPLFNGRKLALFKSNGDLIKQSGDLSGVVFDVCMIDPTTAVVTRCRDNVIDYINIPTLTVNKIVSVGDCCYGITSSDNKLYVGCSNKLLILDKDGNKEKEINTNGCIGGVTIINQGEKIVYTNYNNHSCHFVRSSDLQEVHRFTHPELKKPHGETSDREGNVYIVGQSSGNLFQLSSEGDLIRILLAGLKNPYGIQFDDNSDRFFVSYSYSTKLNIYNMIKR